MPLKWTSILMNIQHFINLQLIDIYLLGNIIHKTSCLLIETALDIIEILYNLKIYTYNSNSKANDKF